MAIAGIAAGLILAGGGSVNANSPSTHVDIVKSYGGVDQYQVQSAVDRAAGPRGDWEQQVVANVREAVDGKYNVVLANLNQSADSGDLEGIRLYGDVVKDWEHVGASSVHYGLWIFERGTFTLNDDGGYENWAFSGDYDQEKWANRDGNVVEFADVDGSGESDPVQTSGDFPLPEGPSAIANTCDLTETVDEIKGQVEGGSNIVVYRADHEESSNFDNTIRSGTLGTNACGNVVDKVTIKWVEFTGDGSFVRKGDGGSRNWAFAGDFTRDGDSAEVRFHAVQ